MMIETETGSRSTTLLARALTWLDGHRARMAPNNKSRRVKHLQLPSS